MKKVTLKDIANKLGVTVGTVSHVLNGVNDISEETKKKVLQTAHELGYISNSSAVSLRTGKTNSIAIIVPDISNPHLAYQIMKIETKMRDNNYSVIILNTSEDEKLELNAIKTAIGKQVDGVLICPCQQSKQNIEFLSNTGIPFALFGRFFRDYETDYICADDIKGGYLAGEYLLKKGYKRPVYVGSYKYIEASINRFAGLKKAFLDSGIELSEDRFLEVGPKADFSDEVFDKVYKSVDDFDSVVAFSDLLSFKIKSYLNKVSEKDIPVVGFDAVNSHLFLPITNVSVGMVGTSLAEKTAEVILAKMNGSKEKFREIIDVKLFEFNSSI